MGGSSGAGAIPSPMPVTRLGADGEAHRHVGAQCQADPGERRAVGPPQMREREQGRGGVGRAAAEAGGDRDVLGEAERAAVAAAGGLVESMGGTQREVVATLQAGRGERPVKGERERARGRVFGGHGIAKLGEGDQRGERVVAVGAPAGDVEVEVELGRGGDG